MMRIRTAAGGAEILAPGFAHWNGPEVHKRRTRRAESLFQDAKREGTQDAFFVAWRRIEAIKKLSPQVDRLSHLSAVCKALYRQNGGSKIEPSAMSAPQPINAAKLLDRFLDTVSRNPITEADL